MTQYLCELWRTLRWLEDKVPTSNGLERAGMWRVIYFDGKRTRRVTYDAAVSLAEIFGGEVVWVRYDDNDDETKASDIRRLAD